jgi:hypothetical protein
MLLDLTYPVVLTGLPAGHRREKRCLLARTVSHEIADIAGAEAPVVMSYRHSDDATVLERRVFDGRLYSPLGIAVARLAELTRAAAFRADDPMVGDMAFEAARAFFALRFGGPSLKTLPDGIGMSGYSSRLVETVRDAPSACAGGGIGDNPLSP